MPRRLPWLQAWSEVPATPIAHSRPETLHLAVYMPTRLQQIDHTLNDILQAVLMPRY